MTEPDIPDGYYFYKTETENWDTKERKYVYFCVPEKGMRNKASLHLAWKNLATASYNWGGILSSRKQFSGVYRTNSADCYYFDENGNEADMPLKECNA